MLVPLHDANPLNHIRRPIVTWALIGANILIFAVFQAGVVLPDAVFQAMTLGLGFIPSVVNDVAELAPGILHAPEKLTYVTYMFLHISWWHLGSNMLFLWVFGDNVEDAMGHVRFLLFYLACGAAGAFVHGIALYASQAPLIGASAAAAGVAIGYLLLHPHVRMWVLVFGRIPWRFPPWLVLGLWVLSQLVSLVFSDDNAIAWWAHLGGMIAGLSLTPLLRRRGVALFDRALPRLAERVDVNVSSR